MDSNKFRKHPGGVKSVFSFINLFLLLGIIAQSILVVMAIVSMGDDDISLEVTAAVSKSPAPAIGGLPVEALRTILLLNFEPRNILEWLLLPRFGGFDVYTGLISIVVTWQLYCVFKKINLKKPFHTEVLSRMTIIHRLILIGIFCGVLRYAYLLSVVKHIGKGDYILAGNPFLSPIGYFTGGTWIIVYLFAQVYKKGVVLQQEQELTI